jgi:thioesterase domain-containing protein/acyl carrier protein
MVPAELIPLKQLPLTPNGKIDRNALPAFDPGVGVNRRYQAPRTETEKLICQLWAEVLGLQKVGIQDDFFELGGHSMVAVQVMIRLEKETGKRLPLATLFEAPTVEKLAAVVSSDEKPVRWESLVPIKPKGSKMPLYIVHGFGMNVLLFNNVAKNMDAEQPVYALQAKGLNASDETLDKMEEIAAYYVSEILEQNPTGPYAIAGYSFGGIIAFEMAKQLKASGKEVVMLGMFDTYADNSDFFDPWLIKFSKKFIRQFPKMFFVTESLFKRPFKTIAYQSDYMKRVLHERFGLFKSYKSEDFGVTDGKVIEKYEYAYRHYKMTPYDGMVDVYKVRTRLYFLDDLEYLGWKPYAKQGVQVHEISGDHKTFLFPPHARDFALVLQRVLDERFKSAEGVKNLGEKHVVLKAV